MRIGLCLSGLVGFVNKYGEGNAIDYQIAYESFINNIFDKDVIVDVFLHSWSVDYEKPLTNLYKPKLSLFEKQINFGSEYSKRQFSIISNHYSKLKVIELKSEFEKNNEFIYDFIVLTRFDIIIKKKLFFNKLNNKKFYVVGPKRHHNILCLCCFCNVNHKNHQLNDFLFVSNSKKMDIFSKAYNYLDEYGLESGHLIASKHIKAMNLWSNIDYIYKFIYNKYPYIWLYFGLKPAIISTDVPLIRWEYQDKKTILINNIILKLKLHIIFHHIFILPYKVFSVIKYLFIKH